VAGGGEDLGDEFGAVERVADGARGDKDDLGRRVGGGVGQKGADGFEATGHPFGGEAGFGAADACADPRVDRAVVARAKSTGSVARRHEDLYGVRTDIDDGDGRTGHRPTEHAEHTEGKFRFRVFRGRL
jgi:hypothetical protein